jgi:hypothetical protein
MVEFTCVGESVQYVSRTALLEHILDTERSVLRVVSERHLEKPEKDNELSYGGSSVFIQVLIGINTSSLSPIVHRNSPQMYQQDDPKAMVEPF